jgi:hypothetical protein
MSDKRKARRQQLSHAASIARLENAERIADCVVSDMSAGGARLVVKQPADIPKEFVLLLTESGNVVRRCQVVWSRQNHLGVRFVDAKKKKKK